MGDIALTVQQTEMVQTVSDVRKIFTCAKMDIARIVTVTQQDLALCNVTQKENANVKKELVEINVTDAR